VGPAPRNKKQHKTAEFGAARRPAITMAGQLDDANVNSACTANNIDPARWAQLNLTCVAELDALRAASRN